MKDCMHFGFGIVLLLIPAQRLLSADCNGNGVDDALDLAPRFGLSAPSTNLLDDAPSGLAAADLDGDGRADLAVVVPFALLVFVDRGARLELSRRLTVGSNPVAVASGDLDRDGDIDLVTANALPGPFAGNVSVFINRGDATFHDARNFAVGPFPQHIAVLDLNGDRLLDVAAVNGSNSTLSVLRGRGDGTLMPATTYRIAPGAIPVSMTSVDIDGDGDVDFVTANRNSIEKLSWLVNDGDGGFQSVAIPSSPEQWALHSIASGDLDGDGDADLVFSGASELIAGPANIFVLPNQGVGAFGERRVIFSGGRIAAVAAADFDRDGDIDLVTTHTGRVDSSGDYFFDSSVAVHLNGGSGNFSAPASYVAAGDPVHPTIADFDGDGRSDIATVNSLPTSVAVMFGAPGGGLRSPVRHYVRGQPYQLEIGDFDADGKVDVASVQSEDESLAILRGEGQGVFSLAFVDDPVIGVYVMTSGDFDGDGHRELAVAGETGVGVYVREDGAFALRIADSGHITDASGIVAGDLNGDGKLDLVATGDDGPQAWALVNQGDARFQPAIPYAVSDPTYLHSLMLGDLDSDGDLDAALASAGAFDGTAFGGAAVHVLLNRGDGTFPEPTRYSIDGNTTSLVAGDLNGDSKIDLIAAGDASAWVSVLRNAGGGKFRDPVKSTVGGAPSQLLTADLDGDADLDVAALNPNPGDIAVLLNDGTGVFASPERVPAGPLPLSLAAADVDGDGNLDLATANLGNPYDRSCGCVRGGSVSILLGRGDGSFAAPVKVQAGTMPGALRFADLDSRGGLDLVVGNVDAVVIVLNESPPPASRDWNSNGVPDECDPGAFHRGDSNDDGKVDLGDPIAILEFLFQGASAPGCLESADADNDARVGLGDAIYVLGYLFRGGPTPLPPGPAGACGLDTDVPGSPGDIGCEVYQNCP